MVLLALGITLNTKAGLGASAIVSVPCTVSQGTGWDFANLTLIVYCILVAAQFVIKGQNRRLIDLLQIVVSIVFTRFMALFQHGITYHSFFCLPATRHKARNGALRELDSVVRSFPASYPAFLSVESV